MSRWTAALLLVSALAGCGQDSDGDGTRDGKDCAAQDASAFPGAEEVCDGIDNDCDGFVDEGVSMIAYWDRDGDGHGDPAMASRVCVLPEDGSLEGDDCNDFDPSIHPGSEEFCDLLDNDCDGAVDEDVTITLYEDADNDGHGVPATTSQGCWEGDGWALLADDCDDADGTTFPGASEVCDELDNDCDAEIDEDLDLIRLWEDGDGDGYGDPDKTALACGPITGIVDNDADCDDSDATINPDATEVHDNDLDEDCDGYLDEWEIPDHYDTLEDALADLPDGSTIQFGTGTFTGNFDITGRDIVLAGEGCDRTVLFGALLDTTLTMDRGKVADLTLAGGRSALGGGLYTSTGEVTGERVCVVANTSVDKGGGIYVESGTLTLIDAVVHNNYASDHGGGAYVLDGAHVEVTGGRFTANSGVDGGAIYLKDSSTAVYSSVFAGNTARSDGGAIALWVVDSTPSEDNIYVENATFHANWANVRGQAIFEQAGLVTLKNVVATGHENDDSVFYDYIGSTSIEYVASWGNAGPEHRTGYRLDAVRVPPLYIDVEGNDPEGWDLRLQPRSLLIDAGDPALFDADSSVSDLGAHGGPAAAPDARDGYTDDWDDDGLFYGYEVANGLNPWVADADSDDDADGLTAAAEWDQRTLPQVADTDGDGQLDATDTDPLDPRTDRPVVALAAGERWVRLLDDVSLDASGSRDPDGDTLTYSWILEPPGTSALTGVDDPTAASVSFSPDVEGAYDVTVVVSDGDAEVSETVTYQAVDGVVVPDDYATIQQAIDASSSGDVVWVNEGAYVGNLDFGGKHLRLLGQGDVVLDGGGLGPVITLDDEEYVTLAQLTITGGEGYRGGGIYAAINAELELVDVTFVGNHATDCGAGLYTRGADVFATRIHVEANHSDKCGGGAAVEEADATFDDSVFAKNTAGTKGGALYFARGIGPNQRLSNTVLVANTAGDVGSAIFRDVQRSGTELINVAVLEHAGTVLHADEGYIGLRSSLVAFNPADVLMSRDTAAGVTPLYTMFWNNTGAMSEPTGDNPGDQAGTLYTDPMLTAWSADGIADNDLLAPRPGSPMIDAGFPEHADPDLTRADIGIFGGPGAPSNMQTFAMDTDGDGLSDGWELEYGLDPDSASDTDDDDDDGLTNAEEWAAGTRPDVADTDGDGVDDGTEVADGDDPIDPSDHRPTADAGADLRVHTADLATLDGSASSDPNGDSLTYAWTFVSRPPASGLTDSDISGASTDTASFTPDERGNYRLQLVVHDGSAASLPDEVVVTAYGDLLVPSEYPTIEDALAEAIDDDTVYLEAGTYEALVDSDGVSVRIVGEGIESTEIVAVPGYSVVRVDGGAIVELQDLTLTEGSATQGGGIDCEGGGVVLTDVLLTDNLAYQGGAIALEDCTGDFTDVHLIDNHTTFSGGAAMFKDSDVVWTRGRVAENSAGSNGGALYTIRGTAVLDNLVIYDNIAESIAGGLYQSYGDVDAVNVSFVDNDGDYGAWFQSIGTGNVKHVLFAGNRGYGFYKSGSTTTYRTDTSYNGYWDNDDGETTPSSMQNAEDVIGDPLFVGGGDLRLREGSPMIDAGDPAVTDRDGTTADIGAWGGAAAGVDYDLWYVDSDGDGMADGWELANGLDPGVADDTADADGDGLSNGDEYAAGTDPNVADTDGDGTDDDVDGAPLDGSADRPVADAGLDVVGTIASATTLDGSGSSDPNGDTLTWAWTFASIPGRSALTDGDISNAGTSAPSFTPDVAGAFVVQLIVGDGVASSAPDSVTVSVAGDLLVPEDYPTVGEAIAAATDGATIEIGEGSWPLNADLAGKSVTLAGAGPDVTVLDGGAEDSVLTALAGETLVLEGLAVSNGFGLYGGAVDCDTCTLDLTDVWIADNGGVYGGGLAVQYGTVTGVGVRIVDNASPRFGGGIYAYQSTVELSQVLVAGNLVTSVYGGGLYVSYSDVSLSNALVVDNEALSGGGLYVTASSTNPSQMTLEHVTLVQNAVDSFGGGLQSYYADFVVTDTIIAFNGPGYGVSASSAGATTWDQRYSLVFGNTPIDFYGITDPSGSDGNLSEDPEFADVTDDGDWSNDDYALTSGSPAVDAGDPAGADDPDGTDPDMGAFGGPDGEWTP